MLLKRIKCLLIIFSIFCLISCSNAIGGKVSYSSEPAFEITVTNYSPNQSSDSSRILKPENLLSYSDIQAYVLEGASNYSTFNRPVQINSNGTASFYSVAPAVWNLILHAYSDAECTVEVMRGYALADNRNSTADVTFTLSTDLVSTTGSANFTLKVEDAESCSNVQCVTVGLYNMGNGESVSAQVVRTGSDLSPLYTGNPPEGITYSASNLKAGNYFLKVHFYNDLERTKQCGFYSEEVVIEPGQETSGVVNIPDVVNTVPIAPTGLKAYLVEDSCKDSFYTVLFTWNDNSFNERYFKLYLKEFSEYTTWITGGVEYITYSGNSFAQSQYYVDGSLFAGSKWCAVRLPTGIPFEASISAVNSIGESSVCPRITSSDVSDASDSATAYFYEHFGSLKGYQTGVMTSSSYATDPNYWINCVQITYNLNGGILKTAENSVYQKSYFCRYEVYEGNAFNIMEAGTYSNIQAISADSSNQNYPILYLGTTDYPFASWERSDNIIINNNSYGSFNDLTLYANYANTNPSLFEVPQNRIFIKYGASTEAVANGAGTDCKNGSVPSGNYVAMSILGDGTDVFTQYKFYVNSSLQSTLSADNVTNHYTSYNFFASLKGSYVLQISGVTSNNSEYYLGTYELNVN
ncbi:MAG: hypothetical protein K6A43_00935 [Treponema sp.]|nr:hypothetical protein [Treponema sp.]